MSLSVNAAAAALAATAKPHPHAKGAGNELNPAKQAKAADPAVKGAEFGALVSQFARAKHAPPAPVVEPVAPVVTPPTETTVDIVV